MDFDTAPNIFWSNFAGYVSICCWLVVFTPQIWENYTRKSGEGLSMLFLWIWLLGDVFNLAGILMQDLLFTMLLLAIYYTLADTILIIQVLYYRRYLPPPSEPTEQTPLVASSSHAPASPSPRITRTQIIWGVVLLLVIQISTFVYLWGIPARPPSGPFPPDEDLPAFNAVMRNETEIPPEFRWLPALMGWASAALYCGSRVPQIVKNFRKRSTEGLSFFMFGFSVLGNATYCLSIFIKSMNPQYLLVNLPWLVGSGGTLLFDLSIFIQFYTYHESQKLVAERSEGQAPASEPGMDSNASKRV